MRVYIVIKCIFSAHKTSSDENRYFRRKKTFEKCARQCNSLRQKETAGERVRERVDYKCNRATLHLCSVCTRRHIYYIRGKEKKNNKQRRRQRHMYPHPWDTKRSVPCKIESGRERQRESIWICSTVNCTWTAWMNLSLSLTAIRTTAAAATSAAKKAQNNNMRGFNFCRWPTNNKIHIMVYGLWQYIGGHVPKSKRSRNTRALFTRLLQSGRSEKQSDCGKMCKINGHPSPPFFTSLTA